MAPKGTCANGAIQAAPLELVIFLHVLSSDTLTRGEALGPLGAAHRAVLSALLAVFLQPLLFLLGLPGFTALGALVGNRGMANAFSEPDSSLDI